MRRGRCPLVALRVNPSKTSATDELIEALIRRSLAIHKIEEPPVPSNFVCQLYDKIKVVFFDWKRLHGAIKTEGDTLVIGLNRNDPPEQQRYTLYHEIGHFGMAHLSKRFGVFLRHPKGAEYVADRTAMTALMPRNMIFNYWDEITDVKAMAKLFVVPEEFMLQRLLELGLIEPPRDEFDQFPGFTESVTFRIEAADPDTGEFNVRRKKRLVSSRQLLSEIT